MGKICRINGQPYSAGLPTGGTYEGDPNNQWDEMIDFLGEDSDNVFHWVAAFSWCQNESVRDASYRAVRGFYSARSWSSNYATHSLPLVGFRPVLAPLNTDTLEPDPTLLKAIPNGRKIAVASLYMGGKPVNLSEEKGPNYNKREKIILGDRDKNRNNWLYVIKYKDLLWADRNILVNISWNELRRQGFTD